MTSCWKNYYFAYTNGIISEWILTLDREAKEICPEALMACRVASCQRSVTRSGFFLDVLGSSADSAQRGPLALLVNYLETGKMITGGSLYSDQPRLPGVEVESMTDVFLVCSSSFYSDCRHSHSHHLSHTPPATRQNPPLGVGRGVCKFIVLVLALA
jgi:hypothetical protein